MTPQVQDWNDPAAVADWLETHAQSNPGRAGQLAMVLTLLGQVQATGLRLLDLGCGDGMVSEMVLTQLPGSVVVGLDLSAPMLAAAEARLAPYAGRYTLYQRALDDPSPLVDQPLFDAAIGVQSIHHLDGAGKAALFRWVADHLRPAGLLVLSDRVRLPDAALFPYFRALHDAYQRDHGAAPSPPDYGYAAHRRALDLRADVPDTVEDQLAWMRAAGFGAVDCFYRHTERAIFGGLKQPATPADQPLPGDRSATLITHDNAANGMF
ncbi:MAG: class I SAM-dependent methyltransferase [Chloroflexota bacterium]|nr:class I SAM-dependent methyltransferase [Chloroflexota bacterium]